MIDRGDLAEIGFTSLYNAVEDITRKTKVNGKPLIMATEKLESMSNRETPSKSEVISLAHSVSIGSDRIMLSEETAVSENATLIVEWLDNFLNNSKIVAQFPEARNTDGRFDEIWKFLSENSKIPVLLLTKSGHALCNFMKIRPHDDVIVVTNNPKIKNVAKLYAQNIRFNKSKHR